MAAFAPGAQRERQDGDDREGRVEPQEARAVPQILPDGLEQPDRVHLVDLLADPGGIPELSIRRRPRGVG